MRLLAGAGSGDRDVLFLIGDDAHRPAADSRVAAEHGLAVFGAVFFEFAAVHDARDDFAHVVLLARGRRKRFRKFLRRIARAARRLVIERARGRVAHFVDQRADALEAGVVIRLAEIDVPLICACIFAPPSSSAEVFCPMAACTSAGPARKSPLPSVIRMWSHITGRYAPPATHMPMIAVICGMPMALITALLRKTRPKSSVSGKTSSCRGQKNAGGIDQINRGDAIFDGDVLRADHFLRGHREKSARFDRGVVGDDHHQPAGNAREAGDRSRGGRAAPFLVHFVGGVDAQLEEVRFRIDQLGDALARREAAFLVLRFDGFGAAALADLFFFVFDFGEAVHHLPAVLLECGGLRIDVRSDVDCAQRMPSRPRQRGYESRRAAAKFGIVSDAAIGAV